MKIQTLLRLHITLVRIVTTKKAAEMAHRGDMLATKVPDLRLIPKTPRWIEMFTNIASSALGWHF